jgi:hypothetical protein
MKNKTLNSGVCLSNFQIKLTWKAKPFTTRQNIGKKGNIKIENLHWCNSRSNTIIIVKS